MPNDDNFELLYEKLMEGQQYLDLMYLPSDAIAWLFDQPEQQVQTAMQLAKETHIADNPVVNATLLKDDQLIVICELSSGRKIRIYPDGGLSSDGQPYDLGSLVSLIADEIPGVEQGAPMDAPGAVDPMEPVGQPPVAPEVPDASPGDGYNDAMDQAEPAGASLVVAPDAEPTMEPGPEDALGMEDDLLGGMGTKSLSDLM